MHPNLAGSDYVYLTTDVEGVRLDKVGPGAEVGPIDGVRTTCFTIVVGNEEWKLELMSTPASKVGLCHLYSGAPVTMGGPIEEALRNTHAAMEQLLAVQRSLELCRDEREELEMLRREVRENAVQMELSSKRVHAVPSHVPVQMASSGMRRTPPQRRPQPRSVSPSAQSRMLLSPLPLDRNHIAAPSSPSRSPTRRPQSSSPPRRDMSPSPTNYSSSPPPSSHIDHPHLGPIMAPTYDSSFMPAM
eukprot:TRINITY_DN12652_c0_g1_i1.p1 TRINITY_DN12652_c0_g1~~TRINITY_DN12652_c0_g1_i1.p1  ORF type:complete len:245 (+),score=40.88 TRINITY_DN12652_c0_g1_i1:266-1000(+)